MKFNFLLIRLCFIKVYVYTYPNPKPIPYNNVKIVIIVVLCDKKHTILTHAVAAAVSLLALTAWPAKISLTY